jgi:ABC-2 type transport system ATP-binding protein
MPAPSPVITCSGLSFAWPDGTDVFTGLSLVISPGRTGLVGVNGSGKSTLLRLIAGVSVPTKGTVTGRPATGFVPERFPPGLPFTAQDYLAHLGRIQGLDGEALDGRIEVCLGRLGGLEFASVPMRNMSKGMCQKVAVAQALLPESGMLVLDEAWTGLDADARAALDEVVAERLAEGGSVVFVDHDPRRLEHLEAERWRIERGQAVGVTSVPDAGPAQGTRSAARVAPEVRSAPTAPRDPAAPRDPITPPAPRDSAMIIYVSGCPAERLENLPGVLSAQDEDDGAVLRVEPGASDAVLRAALASGDDVHIRQVGREPESERPDSGEQR